MTRMATIGRIPAALLLAVALGACGPVRERTVIAPPTTYADAQVATLQELTDLINREYAGLESLVVSRFEVEMTGGSIEDGYFERYRKARGYLVTHESDSIFVNILNPLTNSSVLSMASSNGRFQIWIPSRNQFVTGSTGVRRQEENPIYNVRPSHILEGILFEALPDSKGSFRHFLEEEEDSRFKYYVVAVVEDDRESGALRLHRKIWIERSQLRIVRQHYYEGPELQSAIVYNQEVRSGGRRIPTQVEIKRPEDRYEIRFQFEPDTIETDREIQSEAFVIAAPPGAEIIEVREGT